ncbi:hypothetical protein L9F63_005178 [Diploptera punctata]|uniref:Uncharacterized protein n=1 Tax=Diploptera punctata TaxID=6984 RepID=A0AAD7ZDQ6_DIPPU|nr:hypothetical protein L9F63_005178 [Diploptera punctata]
MHFWIDKRSQTCGFSGRHRVPASLSAAGCGQTQRRQRRRSRGKPMVTPVHRFQPIECVGGGIGGQHGTRRNLHHHQQLQHHHHRQLHNCLPPAYGGLTSPAGGMRSTGPHAVELDSSVFLDLPLDGTGDPNAPHNNHQLEPQLMTVGSRLKCGMWASFALATVFVAGAKFYFDHQGAGLEVLVFCTLLVVFLLAGCTVSLCRSKATRDLITAAVTSSSQPPHSTTSHQGQMQAHDLETASSEDMGLDQSSAPPTGPSQAPLPAPEPPPPPYHIAILLPQQNRNLDPVHGNDESPPPSYDKAVS